MSFRWVVLGTVLQLMLAYFLFMLVVFSAAVTANGSALSDTQTGILDFSIYALPATCLVSAGIVIYLYNSGSSASSYWWYGFPLAAMALYLAYVLGLSSGSGATP